MSPIIFIIFYLVCGFLAAGMLCAYVQGECGLPGDYRSNLGFSLLFGFVFGPLCLIVAFFMTGFAEHGISLRKRN